MPVRKFNGTTDVIKTAIGGVSGKGAHSMAVLLNTESVTGKRCLFELWGSSDSTPEFLTNGTALNYYRGGNEVTAAGLGPTVGHWTLLAVTKAAGTVKPKMYRYDFTTTTLTSAEANATLSERVLAPANVFFGAFDGLEEFFSGKMAAAAVWNVALTEAQIKELFGAATLEGWKSIASPQALWFFNQAKVEEEVKDKIGAANQTAIVGTSVVLEEPPIPYASSGKTVEIKANLTSVSVLSATVTRTAVIKAALSSASGLSAKLERTAVIKAALTSASSLTAKLIRTRILKAALTSVSVLTAKLETSGGAKTVEIKAALTSVSVMSAKLTRTATIRAALTSTSTLTAKLIRTRVIKAALASISTLTAKLTRTRVIKAALVSHSVLSARLEISAPFGIEISSPQTFPVGAELSLYFDPQIGDLRDLGYETAPVTRFLGNAVATATVGEDEVARFAGDEVLAERDYLAVGTVAGEERLVRVRVSKA